MAHVRFRLVLLYPYPDTVHGGTLHETLRSTSLTERGFPHADPKEAFGSAIADCRYRAPLTPPLILNFYQIVYLLLSTDFLRAQNPTHWRKELYRTVATQTSYDTCGSVVRDTSLEVCRVHSHFSELCWGTCCAGNFFLLGGIFNAVDAA